MTDKNRTSTYAWKQLRRNRIRHARDHHEPCYRCGQPINYELRWPHPGSPEVDHIIPVARGGTDHPENLAVSCKSCNSRYGAGPATSPPAAPRYKPTPIPDGTRGYCPRHRDWTTSRNGNTACCGGVLNTQDWLK